MYTHTATCLNTHTYYSSSPQYAMFYNWYILKLTESNLEFYGVDQDACVAKFSCVQHQCVIYTS